MRNEPDLSIIAALIGEPTRAAILSALLGGQALPASELAYRAQVTPQTTSSHLNKLVEGGLLSVIQTGRHRYYQLKNEEVARILESLALISPPLRAKSRQDSAELQALCNARTCYDHLAGKLGVVITQAFIDKKFLIPEDQTYQLSELGRAWLADWQIDEAGLRRERRHFARACLDWSERRHHLAGALGAAVAHKFFENGWIVRVPETRTVTLTQQGQASLQRELGLNL